MASIAKRETTRGPRYDVRTRVGGRVVTRTFPRRKDADAWASTTEADKVRGVVVDPRKSRVDLKTYSAQWLEQRSDLAERTRELYKWLLDKQITPELGSKSLAEITPAVVRTWNASIARDRAPAAAKAYRLLSTIMRTAVSDEVIARNPCQVKGASSEHADERPVASIAEVEAMAAAMPAKVRASIYLAAWCQLRRAELFGLRRRDVDLLRNSVAIVSTRTRSMTGKTIEKEPKTTAGRRTVAIPENIVAAVKAHLDEYVGVDPGSLVFDVSGRLFDIDWHAARKAAGRSDLHLHDLRHSGLTWSAATGATTAELMRRAGHASPAASIRYQHATEDRDRALAAALAKLVAPAEVVELKQAE